MRCEKQSNKDPVAHKKGWLRILVAWTVVEMYDISMQRVLKTRFLPHNRQGVASVEPVFQRVRLQGTEQTGSSLERQPWPCNSIHDP